MLLEIKAKKAEVEVAEVKIKAMLDEVRNLHESFKRCPTAIPTTVVTTKTVNAAIQEYLDAKKPAGTCDKATQATQA